MLMADGAAWLCAARVIDDEGGAMSAEDLYSSVCHLQAEDQAAETALRATQRDVAQLRDAIAARATLTIEEEQQCQVLQRRVEQLCPMRRAHELAHSAACHAHEALRVEVNEIVAQLMRGYDDDLPLSLLPFSSSLRETACTAGGRQDVASTTSVTDDGERLASVAEVMSLTRTLAIKLHAARVAQAAAAHGASLMSVREACDDIIDVSRPPGAATQALATSANDERKRVTFDESCIEVVTLVEGVNANRTHYPVHLPFELTRTASMPPTVSGHARRDMTGRAHTAARGVKRARHLVQRAAEADATMGGGSARETCSMTTCRTMCREAASGEADSVTGDEAASSSSAAVLCSGRSSSSGGGGVAVADTIIEGVAGASQHSAQGQRGAPTMIVLPVADDASRRATRPRKTVWRLLGGTES